MLPINSFLTDFSKPIFDRFSQFFNQWRGDTLEQPSYPELGDIRGQVNAKTALLLAAAGRHNLLMIGPPGEGKTMLANAFPGLLPNLSPQQSKEVTEIYQSLDYIEPWQSIHYTPYRSIHHTTTITGMVGGGRTPTPGEVTLAHHGVLFLDELTEFSNKQLETLRQPLEDKEITISRVEGSETFPCDFQFIASCNPCPCGYAGTKRCSCDPQQIKRYMGKISGPILDRIDIIIRIYPVSAKCLFQPSIKNQSKYFKNLVTKARLHTLQRSKDLFLPDHYNSSVSWNDWNKPFFNLTENAKRYLEIETETAYTTRKRVKLIQLSRTIADLYDNLEIHPIHIQVAREYMN